MRAGSDEENRNLALVPDGSDRAAVEQIAEEAVAVRGHRDQVALLLLGGLENLVGGLPSARWTATCSPAPPSVAACDWR